MPVSPRFYRHWRRYCTNRTNVSIAGLPSVDAAFDSRFHSLAIAALWEPTNLYDSLTAGGGRAETDVAQIPTNDD